MRSVRIAIVSLAAWTAPLLLAGCESWTFEGPFGPTGPRPTSQPVPPPIDLLLPRSIHFQGFTGGPRALDPSGRARGIEVFMAAKDSFGHAAKAFGDFRFALYEFLPNSRDARGAFLDDWVVSTSDSRANMHHWNEVHRMYEFRLRWAKTVPVGTKLVLEAVFSSPFTERLFDQTVFTWGE